MNRKMGIRELVKLGEGQTVEFKLSIPKNFARTICGMANASGGTILLGVGDDGSIEGIDTSNKMISAVENHSDSCSPPVHLTVEREEGCLIVHVPESSDKPVMGGGQYCIRRGSRTVKLLPKEVKEMGLVYNPPSFDKAICRDFVFPDGVDISAYETWRRSLPPQLAKMPPAELLPKLAAAEPHSGGLLFRNAAVLMFAKDPLRFVPYCQVTYLLFNGASGTRIVKRQDFALPIPLLFDSVMELFERHMNTAYVLTGKPRRTNIPEYPVEAVREALANAVVHRDWNLRGANVFFELHSDRLCVKSPGGFPLGVTAENIHASCVRRNELLADLMQRGDLIEKAGTGIARMREECEAHGTPPPEIADIGHLVTVTFTPHPKAVR